MAQKVGASLGTNNVDNAARLCHAPSTRGDETCHRRRRTTCSYKDCMVPIS